jgi:DNA helicase-4
MKSNQYSIAEIKHKAEKIEDGFLRKRSQLFLDIIKPIYDGYEAHLAKEKVIDFSDMINKATKYISSRKYKKKISYVIIDEFQDISIGRYNLVKEIKKSNPSCRLFCVGDDWQSIYRFTGSDIALFKDFSKYFGVTEKLKIETTYRFHNPLIDLSSQFIQQNPNQAKKELHSADSNKKTNYQIKHSRKDDTSTLIDIFNELVSIYDDVEDKKITILARHNFDLENRIKNEDNILSIDKKNNISYPAQTEDGDIKNIRANFQSVHSAKGLEADVVIIINCNAGKYGFPNQMADDPTLNLLLSEADQFENGEERRLFYVAMTRAKEMLYFITDSYKKSKFILEIETESGQGTQMKCPICKTGDINPHLDEAKNGNRFIGYNCSNWMYKCPGKGMVFEDKPNWIEDDWIRFSKN